MRAKDYFRSGRFAQAADEFLREASTAEKEDLSTGREVASLYSNASLAFLLASQKSGKNEQGGEERKEEGEAKGKNHSADTTVSLALDQALSAANLCISSDPSWSKGYFRRAEVALSRGELETAIEDYESSLARLPEGECSDKDRGVVEAKVREAKEALSTLEQLREAEADLVELKEREKRADRDGEKDKSVEELAKAAEERDRNPEAKLALERASRQMAEGDTEACFANLRHALRVDPSCFQASLQCGMILANKGDNEGALEYFQKTLQCQPGCLSAYILMSQVLQQMDKHEEAEQLLKQVVGFAFDNPEVWSALAMVLYKQGKIQEGVETLKYALTGGPYAKFKKPSKDSMVLFCLGFFMAALGYLAEPCSVFMKICQQDSSPTTLYMMAQMCRLVNDKALSSQALFSLCKAYEMSPLAFCSELIVFSSTFDLPQWDDLTSKRDIFKCLKNAMEGDVLQTYVVPEESKDLAQAIERKRDHAFWIVRGETPKITKVVKREDVMLEGLFSVQRGLVQPYVKPKFRIKGCQFSLHYMICVSSYYPLQVAYDRKCYAVLSPTVTGDPEDTVIVEEEEEGRGEKGRRSSDSILSFDELQAAFDDMGIDSQTLWVKLREKITSAMFELIRKVLKDKGQSRAKRFSELGLPKALSMEFVLDQHLEPWLVDVNRTPNLKNVTNAVFTDTILGAIVYSLGRHMFEASLGKVTLSSDLPFQQQKLYEDFKQCKQQYELLNMDCLFD